MAAGQRSPAIGSLVCCGLSFPFQEEKLIGMQEASLDSSSPGSEGDY